jgi:haloalkane dehalogenase
LRILALDTARPVAVAFPGASIMSNANLVAPQPMPSAADPHPRRRIAVLDSEMSYVDLPGRDADADPIVFLHGNPTSSYLWRNIIPHVAGLGRCLAPDLIGMGQSGKIPPSKAPSAKAPSGRYDLDDHIRYLDAWFEALDLRRQVTLVLHDWGSVLGFHWARRFPERVKAIAYMEALVQPRLWSDFPAPRAEIFRLLRGPQGEQRVFADNFFIETVLPKSIMRPLSDAEMVAYRAPFVDPATRGPTLAFARQLPIEGEPADVAALVADYAQWMATNDLPKLFIAAEPGALLTGRARDFCRSWRNQREFSVAGIHYVQEDSPDEIGRALRDFLLDLAPVA